MSTIPKHVAIIMDGNRRWAKQKGLKIADGHREGVEALEKVVRAAAKLGVTYLTVYALSTENLRNRAKTELKDLFSLLQKGFVDKLPMLKKEGVKVTFFGQFEKLPLAVRVTLGETQKRLSAGNNLQLNIAISYGSRAEILAAIEKTGKEKKLSEEEFSDLLYSAGLPDPELIIRTGGEKRLSNFLLWQAAYSELYFTDVLWPDFDEKELKKAVEEYKNRKRNFGA